MLKRLITIALLVPTLLWAKVPDEDDILLNIIDSKSEFYYPNLMLRFEMGDVDLTAEQYHYLYYGYAYQEEYQPLEANPQMETLIAMTAEINIDAPEIAKLHGVISIADQILKLDPFNPKVWNILAFAYGGLNDKIKEREAFDRVEKILQTIDSSGDGLREKSPKHIIMFDHALALMSSENLNFSKPMIVSRNVEFVPLYAPMLVDGKKFKGYFFDFSRVYRYKPKEVTYTRDRTWQFNNLKPREYK
ncbi:MAG: DUF4919 domain-containing protein [Rikenellaceae bacterium]